MSDSVAQLRQLVEMAEEACEKSKALGEMHELYSEMHDLLDANPQLECSHILRDEATTLREDLGEEPQITFTSKELYANADDFLALVKFALGREEGKIPVAA